MLNLKKYFFWLPWLKARRRNRLILISAVVLVMVIGSVMVYYFYFYPFRDSLLAHAPADSAVYIHFNLLNGMMDYQRLNLKSLYGVLDEWFDWPDGQFEKDILPLVGRELALVALPWQNEKNELNLAPALLIGLSRQAQSAVSPTQLEVLGLYYAFLNRRQLVIANSAVALEKIVGPTAAGSLKNQATIKRGLARLSQRALVKGYLAVDSLAKYYQPTAESSNWSDFNSLLVRLSADFLLRQNNRQIYFSVSPTGDGFNFKVNGLTDNLAFKPLAGRRLVKFIPANTLLVLSGFNWPGLLAQLAESFQDIGSDLNNFKANYEKLYRFNWEQDLAPLLAGPGELVVLKDEKNKFILSVKPPAVSEEQLKKLETIVKEYLAYHWPTAKARVLPDKSRITELITDPSQFSWQKAELTDLKVNFTKLPTGDFEFLYTFLDDKLIFSNSLEQFKIFLSQQPAPSPDWLNFNQALRRSFWTSGQEAVLFNLQGFKSGNLIKELLVNFNYLTIVNTRSGFRGNIY